MVNRQASAREGGRCVRETERDRVNDTDRQSHTRGDTASHAGDRRALTGEAAAPYLPGGPAGRRHSLPDPGLRRRGTSPAA